MKEQSKLLSVSNGKDRLAVDEEYCVLGLGRNIRCWLSLVSEKWKTFSAAHLVFDLGVCGASFLIIKQRFKPES